MIVPHFCISTPVLDKNCNIYQKGMHGKNNIVTVNNGIDIIVHVRILEWYYTSSSER